MAVDIGWVWEARNITLTTANLIAFYGVNYGDPIKVGEFNKSTHIRKSTTEDIQLDTGGSALRNYTFVTDTEVSVNSGYPVVLSGSNPPAGYGITITLRDIGNVWAFKVLTVRVFAFTGADMTVPATGVEVYMFEFGQSRWNRLFGSANPSFLTQRLTPATRHTWEVGFSLRPTEVVDKTATIRLEADIQ
jgi:hypothetical protein